MNFCEMPQSPAARVVTSRPINVSPLSVLSYSSHVPRNGLMSADVACKQPGLFCAKEVKQIQVVKNPIKTLIVLVINFDIVERCFSFYFEFRLMYRISLSH